MGRTTNNNSETRLHQNYEVIKLQELKDIQTIMEITADAYGYLPWTAEQFSNDFLLHNSCYYGLLYQKQLIGYAQFHYFEDEYELLNVAILSSFQGQGLGQKLLKISLEQTDASVCFLEVRQSNYVAQNVYQKLGFSQIAARKNYYQTPVEDAVIMRWEIER